MGPSYAKQMAARSVVSGFFNSFPFTRIHGTLVSDCGVAMSPAVITLVNSVSEQVSIVSHVRVVVVDIVLFQQLSPLEAWPRYSRITKI